MRKKGKTPWFILLENRKDKRMRGNTKTRMRKYRSIVFRGRKIVGKLRQNRIKKKTEIPAINCTLSLWLKENLTVQFLIKKKEQVQVLF